MKDHKFLFTIGLHQGSTLSLYLFALVMDELTRLIQDEVLWSILFVDDIVLVDETPCSYCQVTKIKGL